MSQDGQGGGQGEVILVALDGSAPSFAALEEARALAADWQARLAVVHVEEPFPGAAASVPILRDALGLPDPLAEGRVAWQVGQERLQGYLEDVGLGERPIERHVRVGSPAQEIRALVDELQPSLLVLGRTGAGKVEQLLLGGTSERLLVGTEVPVLLVGARAVGPSRRLLVPVDFGPCTAEQLRWVCRLPLAEGAAVTFLSVYALPSYFWDAVERDVSEAAVEEALRQEYRRLFAELFACRAEGTGAHFVEAVRQGVPTEEILAFAQEEGVDSVVVGDRGSSAFSSWLPGSTALKVSRAFPGNVWVIPGRS